MTRTEIEKFEGHTPGPWLLGEWNDHLGYDCMTGGVRAGVAVLDGGDYHQRPCAEISEANKARLMADAALIAAAPALLAENRCLRDALAQAEKGITFYSGEATKQTDVKPVDYYDFQAWAFDWLRETVRPLLKSIAEKI